MITVLRRVLVVLLGFLVACRVIVYSWLWRWVNKILNVRGLLVIRVRRRLVLECLLPTCRVL